MKDAIIEALASDIFRVSLGVGLAVGISVASSLLAFVWLFK